MGSAASLRAHRTFRWNDGRDVDRYEGVDARDDGLDWYRWSHSFADAHGRHDEAHQSWESFLRDGPLREAPAHVLTALRALAAGRT